MAARICMNVGKIWLNVGKTNACWEHVTNVTKLWLNVGKTLAKQLQL